MADKSDWHHDVASPPKDDNEYLERMSRVIFVSGLNWGTVEKKWPGIRRAFDGFDVALVADFDDRKLDELMANADVIRNMPKIKAIVRNAATMQDIAKDYGSFRKYIDSLVASSSEADLITKMSKQFAFLGKSTAVIFLLSIGVELTETTKSWSDQHR